MERTTLKFNRQDAINSLGSNGYYIIDKRLLQLYDANTVLFLINLIDFYKYLKGQHFLGEDYEWFYCSYEQQRDNICLSNRILRECKNALIEDKILQTKTIGMPKVVFYYIDFIRLLTKLKQVKSGFSCPKEIEGQKVTKGDLTRLPNVSYINTIKKKEPIDSFKKISKEIPLKEFFVPNESSDAFLVKQKTPIQLKNEKFLPIAKKLSDIIKTKKNTQHTPSQITSWTNDIRKLVDIDKVSPERINAALKWYAKNIGGAFVPEIQSGSALKDKFEKLENAILRSEVVSSSFKKSNKANKPINGSTSLPYKFRDADIIV